MKIRKYLFFSFAILFLSLLVAYDKREELRLKEMKKTHYFDGDAYSLTKTEEQAVYFYENGEFVPFQMKGVLFHNFYPGSGRNDYLLPEGMQQEWMQAVSDMNANTLYIPYLMPAEFYREIKDYNEKAKIPLYLIQGIPMDEKSLLNTNNLNDEIIGEKMKKEIKNTVNALHGNWISSKGNSVSSWFYQTDVSGWVLGYVIGEGLNKESLCTANFNQSGEKDYYGTYFEVKGGSNAECIIASWMDTLVQYEVQNYKKKSMVSFYTTSSIDFIEHKFEGKSELYTKFDLNHVMPKNDAQIFSFYEIVPGKENFLVYNRYELLYEEMKADIVPKYSYFDYMEEISKNQNYPFLFHFGFSTSFVPSYLDEVGGFHCGGMSEYEQGRALIDFIKKAESLESYGVILKEWQDGWREGTEYDFVSYYENAQKETWQNVLASGECYGLVSFEDAKEDAVVIDGKKDEWKDKETIINTPMTVKMDSDMKYVYFMLEGELASLKNNDIYIGIDLFKEKGCETYDDGVCFQKPVDFVIKLKKGDAEILVQEASDMFYYQYYYYSNVLGKAPRELEKDSSLFRRIQTLNRKNLYFLPLNLTKAAESMDISDLNYGISEEESFFYDSKSNYYEGDCIELRIPLRYFNVINPGRHLCISDCYSVDKSKQTSQVNEMELCVVVKEEGKENMNATGVYRWGKNKKTDYRIKYKQSYDMVKTYWQEPEVS